MHNFLPFDPYFGVLRILGLASQICGVFEEFGPLAFEGVRAFRSELVFFLGLRLLAQSPCLGKFHASWVKRSHFGGIRAGDPTVVSWPKLGVMGSSSFEPYLDFLKEFKP